MRSAFHLLRFVDQDSIIHRIDPRTKVLGITVMALCLALRPGWVTTTAIWSLGILVFLAARLPLGVVPRFPKIVWIGVGVSFFFALMSGREPVVQLAGLSIEVGGLLLQLRFLLVTFGLLFLSLLVGWTTPPAELPGAVRFLLAPFRRLRLPVEDVVTGLTLAIRVMPLLMDELSTSFALWRARNSAAGRDTLDFKTLVASSKASKTSSPARSGSSEQSDDSPDPLAQALSDVVTIAATATTSAVRRANEIGETLTTRGSTAASVTPARWNVADGLAAIVLAGLVVIVFVVSP